MARRVMSRKAASAPVIHTSGDRRKISIASNNLCIIICIQTFEKKKASRSIRPLTNGSYYFTHRFSALSDRRELYIIDGLSENSVAEGRIHSTNTHGSTEQVSVVFNLLGAAFASRIRNIDQQRIYAFSTRCACQRKGYVRMVRFSYLELFLHASRKSR